MQWVQRAKAVLELRLLEVLRRANQHAGNCCRRQPAGRRQLLRLSVQCLSTIQRGAGEHLPSALEFLMLFAFHSILVAGIMLLNNPRPWSQLPITPLSSPVLSCFSPKLARSLAFSSSRGEGPPVSSSELSAPSSLSSP